MAEIRRWIPHKGGKRPIPALALVFIKYRNGFEPAYPIVAEKRVWVWPDGDYAYEIVEYAHPDEKKAPV